MDLLLNIILKIPGMLVAFTFHEFAHAFVADRLGDKTPRFQGRLTLNPLKHVDPFGFICVLFLGIGYAKPVQVNPAAFKNYYKDDLKVSLAGPAANFIVAIIGAIIFSIYYRVLYLFMPGILGWIIGSMLRYIVVINISLGLFNLLPVPTFDGFCFITDIKPESTREFVEACYNSQQILVIIALFFGWKIVAPIASILLNILI